MPVKVFIDTNIVIYALGPYSEKTDRAASLFVPQPTISTQVLSETANVALKKLAMPMPDARKLLIALESLCRVETITSACLHRAFNIVERYGFSWYDSLIAASALEAGCDTLYTEDMQHGQMLEEKLTVTNPFQ
jgi:predicted nucleic acid-binding protein